MIRSVYFKNYRAFREQGELPLRPITLLLGRNSSGKSSLCRLVQLISEAMKVNEWPSLVLPQVRLAYQNTDIIFGHYLTDLMIGASFGDGIEVETEYYIDKDTKMKVSGRCVRVGEVHDKMSDLDALKVDTSAFLNQEMIKRLSVDISKLKFEVDYICPLRTVAKDVYYSSDAKGGLSVSSDGASAYQMLLDSYLGTDSQLFRKVSDWMAKYLDGQRLEIEKSIDDYRFVIERGRSKVRIQEVGQGISQVLPIIVQTYVQESERVAIIEEPELHLHPSAQIPVMERMARTAKERNCCYVVETHSENMVLAVRRMVSRKELSQDDVSIVYVDMDEETGIASVKPIEVKSDGTLPWWPTGVFSEAYDLLNDILG